MSLEQAQIFARRVAGLLHEMRPALSRDDFQDLLNGLKGLQLTLDTKTSTETVTRLADVLDSATGLHNTLAQVALNATGAEVAFMKARYGVEFTKRTLGSGTGTSPGVWYDRIKMVRKRGIFLDERKGFELKFHAKYLPFVQAHKGENLQGLQDQHDEEIVGTENGKTEGPVDESDRWQVDAAATPMSSAKRARKNGDTHCDSQDQQQKRRKPSRSRGSTASSPGTPKASSPRTPPTSTSAKLPSTPRASAKRPSTPRATPKASAKLPSTPRATPRASAKLPSKRAHSEADSKDLKVPHHAHVLRSAARRNYICDVCRRTGTAFCCARGCEWDICQACFDKCGSGEPVKSNKAAALTVPQHSHALRVARRQKNLCDLCKGVGTAYCCARGCDWDVCQACFDKHCNAEVVSSEKTKESLVAEVKPAASINSPPADADADMEPLTKLGPRPLLRLGPGCQKIPKPMMPPDSSWVRPLPKPEKVPAPSNVAGVVGSPSLPDGVGVVPEGIPDQFHTLLVIGPSGSGKSTLLSKLLAQRFPRYKGGLYPKAKWPNGRPIIESFPDAEEGVKHLCSVGMSAVPSWCKPFNVLSKGEQYRASAALKLATRSAGEPAVFDEWTSELDRSVAKAASLALARALGRQSKDNGQVGPVFFATCHDDIVEFLGCDVVIRCEIGEAPHLVTAAPPALPKLCAAPVGSTCLNNEVERASDAIHGRWSYVSASGEQNFEFKVNRRPYSAKVAKVPEGMPGHISIWQLKLPSEKAAELIFESDGADDVVDSSWQGSGWYTASLTYLKVRLRATSAATLLVQTRTDDDDWASGMASFRPGFAGDGEEALSIKACRDNGAYRPEAVSLLNQNGWYVPMERQRKSTNDNSELVPIEARDGLYPGLLRVQQSWVGGLCEVGRGFNCKPQLEKTEEQLTHLVAYVGKPDGTLSDQLEIASRFMDCPFDGVCVHVVNKFPVEEIQDFRIGVILGPSGSGTSALSREMFGPAPDVQWDESASVREHLPAGDIGNELLEAVGLSVDVASRPICTLSGGEQFRAQLARLLIHPRLPQEPLVLEDFTSVLDRPSAKQLSTKLYHYLVKHELRQVVIVSSLRDFVGRGMLQPDWLFEVHSGRLIVFDPELTKLDISLKNLQCTRDKQVAEITARVDSEWSGKRKNCKSQLQAVTKKLSDLKLALNASTPPLSEGFKVTMLEQLENASTGELGRCQSALDELEAQIESVKAERTAAVEVMHQSAAAAWRSHYACHGVHAADSEDFVADACCLTKSPSLDLRLQLRRAVPSEWMFFRKYHYKTGCLAHSAMCFVATLFDAPVAFTSIINNGVHVVRNGVGQGLCARLSDNRFKDSWQSWASANYPSAWIDWECMREHRTVVLPAFQGIGIGSLLADSLARICELVGYAFVSMTVHPQYGGYRDASPFWSALPTSQLERTALKGNLKYCHIWTGATRPDGSIDEALQRRLEDRVDLCDLAGGEFSRLAARGLMQHDEGL